VDGITSGLDADLLDGQEGSIYLDWTNFTSTPTTISGYGITDAFDGTWGSLTSTPTTISGYGITDALSVNGINNLVSSVDNIIDFSLSEVFEILLDSNGVFAASNLSDGQRGEIIFKQDSVGSRTITLPTEFKFPGGVVPTLSTAVNSIDSLSYVISGTNVLCEFKQSYA